MEEAAPMQIQALRSGRLDCPVYLINLDGSDARLRTSVAQLNEAGVAFERVPAVDGRGVSVDHFPTYDSVKSRKYYGRDMTSGEIGCYLSHVMVLKAFLETDQDYCVIFEDDFLAKPGAWEMLDHLEACVKHGELGEWDLINLTRAPKKFKQKLLGIGEETLASEIYEACYFPTRAAAIMWSKAGARRFLDVSEAPLCPIDHLFRKRVSEDLIGLGMEPTPFWFTDVDSDIEMASPGWRKPAKLSWYRVKEANRQIRILVRSYKKWKALG